MGGKSGEVRPAIKNPSQGRPEERVLVPPGWHQLAKPKPRISINMNAKTRTWTATLLALTASVLVASLNAATLKVGDPAPKLQVSKWIQGEPVNEFSKDHAYIVEFWATWCGPCRTSIPHLNDVHNKFKDKGLIVIGQDVWENDIKLVDPFVKEMGKKMTYRVALDLIPEGEKAKGRMAETWMEAAGQNGIPSLPGSATRCK